MEKSAESLEGKDSELEEMEDIDTTQTNPEPAGKKARKILKRKQQDKEIMRAEKRASGMRTGKPLQPRS